MSHNYPTIHPYYSRVPIVVHDHDVLSGRGVNIAHHPGNERFRTLVTTRADEKYCQDYSASEKKAVAEEVIRHIQALNPPGRFLRRDGRGPNMRRLNGPWTLLSHEQAVKKTCQALRDCNRLDRQGYAMGVAMPDDVVKEAERLESSGMTRKEAAATVAATKPVASAVAVGAPAFVTPQAAAAAAATVDHSLKRDRMLAFGTQAAVALDHDSGRVSPSVENAAEWLKRQRTDEATLTAADLTGFPAPVASHHHPSVDSVDAQVMAAADAVYGHGVDLLPATSSMKEADHDAVDNAINYQTHMTLNTEDVHQEGLNML